MRNHSILLTIAGLTLTASLQAATSYTYDELNRLTKVAYDDGRSISYVYDASGNLLSAERFVPAADPSLRLSDTFDGTALNGELWTVRGNNNCGGVKVEGGYVTFFGGTYADTNGKKAFTGTKIVIEAVMAGTRGNRDTHVDLIDKVTGDRIQFGDTSYFGNGLYFYGTGRYAVPQRALGSASTSLFKAYRLSIDGNRATIERGDSLDGPMVSSTVALPNSIEARSFFVRIGTGAADCYYSPGTFDSIKIISK